MKIKWYGTCPMGLLCGGMGAFQPSSSPGLFSAPSTPPPVQGGLWFNPKTGQVEERPTEPLPPPPPEEEAPRTDAVYTGEGDLWFNPQTGFVERRSASVPPPSPFSFGVVNTGIPSVDAGSGQSSGQSINAPSAPSLSYTFNLRSAVQTPLPPTAAQGSTVKLDSRPLAMNTPPAQNTIFAPPTSLQQPMINVLEIPQPKAPPTPIEEDIPERPYWPTYERECPDGDCTYRPPQTITPWERASRLQAESKRKTEAESKRRQSAYPGVPPALPPTSAPITSILPAADAAPSYMWVLYSVLGVLAALAIGYFMFRSKPVTA